MAKATTVPKLHVSVYLTAELHAKLLARADEDRRSVASTAAILIEQALAAK